MRVALTRAALSAASIGLAVVTMAATAPPAAADVKTFDDGGGHLTTVRVRHGADNLRVKANVGPYKSGSHFTFWLDTDRDDPGPEYKIRVYPNSEVLPVRAVETFADAGTARHSALPAASRRPIGPEALTMPLSAPAHGLPNYRPR